MRVLRRPLGIAAAVALTAVVATACAAGSPGSSSAPPDFGSVSPVPPEGEVAATGTVMDVAGEVQLCLGAIAESYPPQCSGIPLEGWSWEGLGGSETSGDSTWGAYAVRGRFDGETLTITRPPILLALYDPIRPEDPTGGRPGTADDETLGAIQAELPERLGDSYVSALSQDGRLWVDVVWDDGTWQQAADAAYGPDVVVVRSALRPTGD